MHTESGRQLLLQNGYWGVVEWVGELSGQIPADGHGLGNALIALADAYCRSARFTSEDCPFLILFSSR